MYRLLWTLLVLLVVTPVRADGMTVDIVDGQFQVEGAPIPSRCFQRLMTDLNGDDVTRSVFLTRSSVRGCIDSNDPGSTITYTITSIDDDDVFEVRICERVEGSMGASCSDVFVRFQIYPYQLGDDIKDVLVMDKLGER